MRRSTIALNALVKTLPTPRASDSNGPGLHGTGGMDLRTAVVVQDWAEYEPAVRRQEAAFGRPAPPPTEVTSQGDRLSARFGEWLMGLPEGHITDPVIWEGVKPVSARRMQLRLVGNGVVPQQCVAAITRFKSDFFNLVIGKNDHV